MENTMIYSEYLFSCLLKIYDKEFDELSYDLQFEDSKTRYEEFYASKHNDEKKSEYDCIINFLTEKYPIHV
jgi:hypothetical protein